mmetsp:Transcript_28235/g.90331  ORF Transcript_28235/g.90331 Transcript_28235/m.90331 type:complete len:258 (-) Transcript_28235:28-801(-)
MAAARTLLGTLLLAAMASPAAPLKVLSLHGKGGNTGSFFMTMAPVLERLQGEGVEFHLQQAPHPMTDLGAYQWWLLRAGERSFTATEYGGFDKTMQDIRACSDEVGPFDCIWGHSQGAILASILLAKQIESAGEAFPLPKMPRFAILNGAAWPGPFGDLLSGLDSAAVAASGLQVLSVIGQQDDINPPEQALELAKCLGATPEDVTKASDVLAGGSTPCVIGEGNSRILIHGGGHIVPTDDFALDAYQSFLAAKVAT